MKIRVKLSRLRELLESLLRTQEAMPGEGRALANFIRSIEPEDLTSEFAEMTPYKTAQAFLTLLETIAVLVDDDDDEEEAD
jgi:hypothetical protein